MSNEKRRVSGLALAGIVTVAGILARKGTEQTWTLVTGDQPPRDQSNANVDIKEAVAWALVSGAVVGLTRLAVRRGLIFRE